MRAFQSRRSLLAWKVFGARLDGWTNADHPTETVPGNPATLSARAAINDADLNFTGTIMPPPGSGVPPLTIDEKMAIARWIDLGAPIAAATDAHLLVTVDDHQGNVTRVRRHFSVGGAPGPSPTPSSVRTPTPARTATPTYTPTPTRTATPTGAAPARTATPTTSATPDGVHDSYVVALRRPVRVRLGDGVESARRILRVRVGNADVEPILERPGHEITVVANDGTCQPGTVGGTADFDRRLPGAQDRALMRGGARRTAQVPLVVRAAAFASPDAAVSAVCQLRVSARGPGVDPTPADNTIEVELRVSDANDR